MSEKNEQYQLFMSDLSQNNGSGAITLNSLADCQNFVSFGKNPWAGWRRSLFARLCRIAKLDAQVPAGIIRPLNLPDALCLGGFSPMSATYSVLAVWGGWQAHLARAEHLTGSYFRHLFSHLER
jgi:hypothetical protein